MGIHEGCTTVLRIITGHMGRQISISTCPQSQLTSCPQVPSSANRVYALAHPGVSNLGLAYAAGIVLSLMGFWNSVIYIVTSRAACRELIISVFSRGGNHLHNRDINAIKDSLSNRRSTQRVSWGDDFERLAEERDSASGRNST